ncbi:hypothetical protein EF902_37420, partial [Streptomyces sp. WAC05858]
MRRVATLFSALTLATLGWTAGTAHAAPAPSPSAEGAGTSVSAEEQRAAARFWTTDRLRAAQDVTPLPAARTA